MTKQEFLAMSLPYGLKCYSDYFNNNYNAEWVSLIGLFDLKSCSIILPKSIIKTPCLNRDISELKPVVHPLTDLTKEIEHNDEKFVPIVILGWSENIIGWSKKNINLAIENMRFDDAIKLIEWHFDIAGLIEKGEAIDVNTLPENPYK